jgi:hypothetical protein
MEEDPSRNDKAEQEARNEKHEQESNQLLELQRLNLYRQEFLTPKGFLGILNVSLLFITTFIALGVLAFYTGHRITYEIVFVISILLIIGFVTGVVWYLRTILPRAAKKAESGEQDLLVRIVKSSLGKSLLFMGNNSIFRLINPALNIYMIADAIVHFPGDPRRSLTIIVIFMVLLFTVITLEIGPSFDNIVSLIAIQHTCEALANVANLYTKQPLNKVPLVDDEDSN